MVWDRGVNNAKSVDTYFAALICNSGKKKMKINDVICGSHLSGHAGR